MSQKNLWGQLPKASDSKAPVQILKEQAALLTEMTRGVLVGEVQITNWSQEISHRFSIRAPALNNYNAIILIIGHAITMYPVYVLDMNEGRSTECYNEGAYISAIENILQSANCQKIVSALLAQSSS